MPRHERPERKETQTLERGAHPRDVRVLQVRVIARRDEVSRDEDAEAGRVNAEVSRRVSVAGMEDVQPEPSRLEEKPVGDDSRGDVRLRRFEQVRDLGVLPALGDEAGMLFRHPRRGIFVRDDLGALRGEVPRAERVVRVVVREDDVRDGCSRARAKKRVEPGGLHRRHERVHEDDRALAEERHRVRPVARRESLAAVREDRDGRGDAMFCEWGVDDRHGSLRRRGLKLPASSPPPRASS